MLILSRKAEESIKIGLSTAANGDMTLSELFAAGPIEIVVLQTGGRRIRVGIKAPAELVVRRDALEPARTSVADR